MTSIRATCSHTHTRTQTTQTHSLFQLKVFRIDICIYKQSVSKPKTYLNLLLPLAISCFSVLHRFFWISTLFSLFVAVCLFCCFAFALDVLYVSKCFICWWWTGKRAGAWLYICIPFFFSIVDVVAVLSSELCYIKRVGQ